jgi:hypothetical protein
MSDQENMIDDVELPESSEDQIEEAKGHDPEHAEKDSVDSVDTAADATKQAAAPKTKAGMINAMYGKMHAMKKHELQAMYSKMQEETEVEEGEEVLELPEFSITDELKALVESEATLSDEFKSKTAVIFETAIRSKLSEEVERLEDEYQSRLNEELNATREDLVEKVDNYLNYVVETWMGENELAIESGLRTEIAEGFMNNLKELFVESYIEVPESKVDLVDELAASVEELEEKLNSQTGSVLEMREKLEEYQRETVIRESARDLADTQVEKLRSLVSSLDFEDEESFAEKVKTVKESYFKKEVTSTEEVIEEDWDSESTVESNSIMGQYLSAIKRTNK